MASSTHKIHKQLITRLFIGCLILASIIGSIVYFVETEQIDDFVIGQAMEEVHFYQNNAQYIVKGDSESASLLKEKIKERLESGHFIIVELYDSRKKEFIEASSERGEAVEKEIDKIEHDFMLEGKTEYKKININGRLHLMVVVPLHDNKDNIIGYFEGVYEVDDETLGSIYRHIIFTTGLVIFVVFITALLLYPIIIRLNSDLFRYANDLLDSNIGMMEVLGNAIAKRDSDTNAHNFRVTLLAVHLGESCGLGRDEMQELIKGAFLHDVGKIGISDKILLKNGRLTDEEKEIMNSHVCHGIDIIGRYPWLKEACDVVKYHHEKYDGRGYMDGLSGEDIPLNGRIFAIVDVFEALTSKRPYKEPFSFEKSMEIIKEDSGSHFDPKLLERFREIAPDLYKGISSAGLEELEEQLKKIIRKYFY